MKNVTTSRATEWFVTSSGFCIAKKKKKQLNIKVVTCFTHTHTHTMQLSCSLGSFSLLLDKTNKLICSYQTINKLLLTVFFFIPPICRQNLKVSSHIPKQSAAAVGFLLNFFFLLLKKESGQLSKKGQR